ncbi:MAG: Crp/Fnr family transcriptional regulator [Silvibacterium sp.]
MLATADIMALIKVLKPRFFEGLSSSDIASIIARATRRVFPQHSVMADEGHPASYLFLIIKGRARGFCMTPKGEKVPIFWFPPGEVCGGAALLSRPVEYLVSTQAVNNSTALVWDRTTIRSLSTQYPALADNALSIAYDYFVAYRALHMSATCHTARQRLAQVLGNLANGMGQRGTEGIELNIRNEELANEANITIFTASRFLSEWQRKGILTKGRGKIVLRSPETLMLSEA